jgi:hypothetical protein
LGATTHSAIIGPNDSDVRVSMIARSISSG